jgi:hypothetical protein
MAQHEVQSSTNRMDTQVDAMQVDTMDESTTNTGTDHPTDEQIEAKTQALRQSIGDLFANGVMERVPARQSGALAQWETLIA